MKTSKQELTQFAMDCTKPVRGIAEKKQGWKFMGYVGAALQTEGENVYTGVNLSLLCGIGFCAEHSAIAEMVKHGETRIATIVAVTANGTILPPCGRCRELIYQIDEANVDTQIILAGDRRVSLADLLPDKWQESFDQPLV